MENSATTTNKRLAIDIPDDLAFSILSKLPLKSLKRFGCLCKTWALLLENPYFMNIYRNQIISNYCSYYDDASLLLHRVDLHPSLHTMYSLSGERFGNKVKLDLPNLFQGETFLDIFGSSSINGILCLHIYSRNVVFWNPATGDFKVIPSSPVEWSFPSYAINVYVAAKIYGFGYDHVRDDYKVIRRVQFLNTLDSDSDSDSDIDDVQLGDVSLDPIWEIYNLRSNSWKKLDVDISPSYEYGRVYMDGVCHWLCKDNYESKTYLVSFDLSCEVFTTTTLPSNIDDIFDVRFKWKDSHLVVLNWSIALVAYHRHMTSFHISILGELGVKESWTKLFIVGPFPCIEHPIGVGKMGEIFFETKDGELAWVDLSTQMIQKLNVRGGNFFSHIVIYKESLLPIGGKGEQQ